MTSFTSNNIGIADANDDAGWKTIGRYWSYQAAQAAVDRLSDASFPVEYVEIVGRDLRLVERVTGHLTDLRAAAAAAGSFAWFGLLIGLLIGLFTTGPAWLGLMLGGLVIGAVWGGIFGLIAHWSTHGRREFASIRGLAAEEYDLLVADGQYERASALIAG